MTPSSSVLTRIPDVNIDHAIALIRDGWSLSLAAATAGVKLSTLTKRLRRQGLCVSALRTQKPWRQPAPATSVITLLLPAAVAAALAAYARAQGQTMQEVIMRQLRGLLRLCTECGLPITGARLNRKVHRGACERARGLRYSREQAKRQPGRTSPHRQQWYTEHPDRRAVEQDRERRRQSETLGRASRYRDAWTSHDLQLLAANPDVPAYALALRLSRTVYAVRKMRSRLRCLMHASGPPAGPADPEIPHGQGG